MPPLAVGEHDTSTTVIPQSTPLAEPLGLVTLMLRCPFASQHPPSAAPSGPLALKQVRAVCPQARAGISAAAVFPRPPRIIKVFFSAIHAFFAGFCEGMDASCAFLDGVFAYFPGANDHFGGGLTAASRFHPHSGQPLLPPEVPRRSYPAARTPAAPGGNRVNGRTVHARARDFPCGVCQCGFSGAGHFAQDGVEDAAVAVVLDFDGGIDTADGFERRCFAIGTGGGDLDGLTWLE